MSITGREMTVTPKVARKWLESVAPNRRVRPHIVSRYAEAMARGEWLQTGEAIKFNVNDELVDGQHRLLAVVESDVTVRMFVQRGLPVEAMTVLDSGVKRNLGDLLKLRDETDTALLGSVLVSIDQVRLAFELGRWPTGRDHYPSHTQCLQLLDAEPKLREAVREGRRVHASMGLAVRPTVVVVGLYELQALDEADAEAFFLQLSGIEVKDGSVVHLFRKRFQSRSMDRPTSTRDQLGLLIKTWNFWRQGTDPVALRWAPGGRAPEKFPVPV